MSCPKERRLGVWDFCLTLWVYVSEFVDVCNDVIIKCCLGSEGDWKRWVRRVLGLRALIYPKEGLRTLERERRSPGWQGSACSLSVPIFFAPGRGGLIYSIMWGCGCGMGCGIFILTLVDNFFLFFFCLFDILGCV